MADVKWIKIVTDIFDDEKVLLIETLPEADSIIVIWFKLLCLAGKQNNSGVFVLNGRIPYTEKMLSSIFRRKESTVQLALSTFEGFGMIELIDGVITIPKWGKHQNLDQLESRKLYMKNYMQGYRDKQKMLTSCKPNSKANVSEADIEEDKNKKENIYSPVIEYLNQKAETNYRPSSKKTQSLIDARQNEGFTLDNFKTVIDKKVSTWKNDPKMCAFLRPETLFGNKFEGYLNEKVARPPGGYGQRAYTPEHFEKDRIESDEILNGFYEKEV